MNEIEFVDFLPTPNDKTIGIATLKLYGKILVRYKVLPTKEGNGFFSSPFSFKITQDGVDSFLPSFLVDSRSEEAAIKTFIHGAVKGYVSYGKGEETF